MTPFDSDSMLESLPGRTVLVVGDVVLDEYLWGDVRRVSPEAPVPVVELKGTRHSPGGAGNAAANVVGLRGRAILGGVIGADFQGERLRLALGESGVDCDGLVIDPTRPTTTKTRIVAHHQQITRLDREDRRPIASDLEIELLRWASRRINEADACILSDYGKGVVSTRFATEFLAIARSAAVPIVVDPKGTDYFKYRRATIITPNMREATLAIGRDNDDGIDPDRLGEELLDMVDGAVLITRGEDGMTLYQKGTTPWSIPTRARSVYDVTGAGDTVVSTLAMCLSAEADLQSAVNLANDAAGIAVGRAGAAVVTIDDLREFYARASSAAQRITV
jgi:D-beta-D-heptose 7-phosphate kinase/D-beta-D-heptose 1-phosphate adenosyltransferase